MVYNAGMKTNIQFKKPEEYNAGDILIPEELIKKRIEEIAKHIAKEYKNNHILIVGVLKGAFVLVADLVQSLHNIDFDNFSVEFMTVSSYKGTVSTGTPLITDNMEENPRNEHVLLVDDIVETALTLSTIKKIVTNQKAKSVKSFVLLSKPTNTKPALKPNFVGFEIPDVWVEGYGMDTDQLGRGNPDIIVGPSKG